MTATTLTSQRTARFTESVIREMTRLALMHNAVNLAQGFPDHETPKPMIEAAIAAMQSGKNQYAITWGTKNLREAIARKVKWYQGISINPEEEITVTCGSTEAMIASLLAVMNPDEEVIIFEPYYENYGPDTILSNATPKFVPMRPPAHFSTDEKTLDSWTFDFDQLKKAFTNKTKAIIINTPNNPTGKVFTREELSLIADLCQKWNVIAVTDEIYEHIFYDGTKHVSLMTLPGMRERTITINAVSKTYAATGWRVGWVVAPPAIANSIRKVHDFLTVGAPHPLQEGAVAALDLPAEYYENIAADYDHRRHFLLNVLTHAGFRCWKPFGAYYVIADFSGIKLPQAVQSKIKDDIQFARWLTEAIGVAGVPGSSFYQETELGKTQIRFSFGRSLQTLQEAEKRLAKLT